MAKRSDPTPADTEAPAVETAPEETVAAEAEAVVEAPAVEEAPAAEAPAAPAPAAPAAQAPATVPVVVRQNMFYAGGRFHNAGTPLRLTEREIRTAGKAVERA